MRKNMKRLVAAFAAAAVMTGTMPFAVFAANSYTAIHGTKTDFKKVLEIDDDTNIPQVTFNFTVTAGDAVNSTSSAKLDVFEGKNPENVVLKGPEADIGTTSGKEEGTITFTAMSKADAAADDSAGDDNNVAINDEVAGDKYYATRKAELDFSQCSFDEPGIYRYIVTENATTGAAGIVNDSTTTRTVDVYVIDNGTNLAIQGYIIYKGTVTGYPDSTDSTTVNNTEKTVEDGSTTGDMTYASSLTVDGTAGEKSVGFKNSYTTHDIEFSKEVTGNQGSKDKYFRFNIEVDGDFDDAQTFAIDTDNSVYDSAPTQTTATIYTAAEMATANGVTVSINGSDVPAVLGSALKAGKDFYLQHGQKIIITGIPEGATYTITEYPEDYVPNATVTAGTDVDATVSMDKTVVSDLTTGLTDDATVAFENHRNGVLPTGIIMSVAPVAVVGIGVLAAIVALFIGSKKRELEEE